MQRIPLMIHPSRQHVISLIKQRSQHAAAHNSQATTLPLETIYSSTALVLRGLWQRRLPVLAQLAVTTCKGCDTHCPAVVAGHAICDHLSRANVLVQNMEHKNCCKLLQLMCTLKLYTAHTAHHSTVLQCRNDTQQHAPAAVNSTLMAGPAAAEPPCHPGSALRGRSHG